MRIEELFPDPKGAALAVAAARGDVAGIESFIRSGADPNAPGKNGVTALLWALGARSKPGVQALLRFGADPSRRADNGISAVTLAASLEDPELLGMVLKAGGDPNLREIDRPALLVAVQNMRWQNMRLLLDHGADINARDGMGMTALYTTAATNQFEQTAYLLNRGADYRIPNRVGGTVAYRIDTQEVDPASDAVRWQAQVRQMLIERGVTFPAATPAEVRAAGGNNEH